MSEELVVIYEAPNPALSFAVKSALEEAGLVIIEQIERASQASDIVSRRATHKRYSRLLCVKSKEKEAKILVLEALAQYEAGGSSSKMHR